MEITVRNVNQAFSEMFWKFKVENLKPEMTRNGPALVYPEPVTTIYQRPQERVLFHHGRDANPIFHLMESIWMLAGRRDVDFLQQFNSTIHRYSDDTEVFNAAYGYRMRHHFGEDQLLGVISLLQKDPTTRQAIVQLWDPADLNKETRDKACNMQMIFDTRGGRLNMAVINRSNDMWWGAYGANTVHFSVIQEFVALALGLPVGLYRQSSHNLHIYTELYNASRYLERPPVYEEYDAYINRVEPLPLFEGRDYLTFLKECEIFCEDPFNGEIEYKNPFFSKVAHPMAMVSRVRRKKLGDGREFAQKIRASDWRVAVHDWINRREAVKPIKEAVLI